MNGNVLLILFDGCSAFHLEVGLVELFGSMDPPILNESSKNHLL